MKVDSHKFKQKGLFMYVHSLLYISFYKYEYENLAIESLWVIPYHISIDRPFDEFTILS